LASLVCKLLNKNFKEFCWHIFNHLQNSVRESRYSSPSLAIYVEYDLMWWKKKKKSVNNLVLQEGWQIYFFEHCLKTKIEYKWTIWIIYLTLPYLVLLELTFFHFFSNRHLKSFLKIFYLHKARQVILWLFLACHF